MTVKQPIIASYNTITYNWGHLSLQVWRVCINMKTLHNQIAVITLQSFPYCYSSQKTAHWAESIIYNTRLQSHITWPFQLESQIRQDNKNNWHKTWSIWARLGFHECGLTTGSDLTDAIFYMLYLEHVPISEYTGRQFLALALRFDSLFVPHRSLGPISWVDVMFGTILPLDVNYLFPYASSVSPLSTQRLHFRSLLPLSALAREAKRPLWIHALLVCTHVSLSLLWLWPHCRLCCADQLISSQ